MADKGPAHYKEVNMIDGDIVISAVSELNITYPHTSDGLTSETISSPFVYIVIKALDAVSATSAQVVFFGRSVHKGTTADTNPNNTNCLTLSSTWRTNPNRNSWTVANINAVELGIRKINTAGQRSTHIYGVVDYAAAATGPAALAAATQAVPELGRWFF